MQNPVNDALKFLLKAHEDRIRGYDPASADKSLKLAKALDSEPTADPELKPAA